MNDAGKIADEIKKVFSGFGFPEDFTSGYDLLECLSHRQNKETFLVRSRSDGRLCVAKCYEKKAADRSASYDILSGLKHPGIPVFLDHFENEAMICFVREFVDGIPLDRYAAENVLSRDEVISICLKLADILSYLHKQEPPVIHRDIKPENVIIREGGELALIDFDTARTFKESEEHDTVFFGTMGYAPPEQYGFSQTDKRSDIYSFGVLLRFLLTNSVRPNDNVRVYRPLQKIIDRCTAFAPGERYDDIDEVIIDLKRANPAAQAILIGRTLIVVILIAAVCLFIGNKIYTQVTYSPFKDGSIVPLVTPDEERQAEAVSYMQDKFGTHIFDDKSSYMTIGDTRQALKEVYGMSADYVEGGNPADPPAESPDKFFPWQLDDSQYIDPDQLAYVVTKVYWPDVVTDWTAIKKDMGMYPGAYLAQKWCDDHDIMVGVNRPKELSRGEAAIAFANADRVYEAMKEMENEEG